MVHLASLIDNVGDAQVSYPVGGVGGGRRDRIRRGYLFRK